jgi:hypothetical protein
LAVSTPRSVSARASPEDAAAERLGELESLLFDLELDPDQAAAPHATLK